MWFGSLRRSVLSIFLLGVALALPVLAQETHRGRKYKAPPPMSTVNVTILRKEDGKPIENAAVIFQLIGDKGNMELKTNEDGKAVIDVLPTGSKVVLQVIAKGFQTYGGEYTLEKAQMSIQVKLNRPGHQYSIYEEHPQQADLEPNPPADKNKNARGSADEHKGAGKDQPAESAKESESKPEASQPQPQ
jgi:pyruvate/2-oxoglutarate dehydrogenase complex dihydrolipoamide acyltransferase (E2) component